MKFTITLIALVTGSLLLNKLQAQVQKLNLPVKESDTYNTFFAIFDETGFNAAVYQDYEVLTTVPKKRQHGIETWEATEAWKALSGQEQSAYLEGLGRSSDFMLINGVEVICWGVNIADKTQLSNIDFFTIWSLPNEEEGVQFVADPEWYTYFRQVNIRDKNAITQKVLGYLFRQ